MLVYVICKIRVHAFSFWLVNFCNFSRICCFHPFCCPIEKLLQFLQSSSILDISNSLKSHPTSAIYIYNLYTVLEIELQSPRPGENRNYIEYVNL